MPVDDSTGRVGGGSIRHLLHASFEVRSRARHEGYMFTLFDAAVYTADPTPLRETFRVQTLEEWTGQVPRTCGLG